MTMDAQKIAAIRNAMLAAYDAMTPPNNPEEVAACALLADALSKLEGDAA